jgi:hypothetical protein
VEDINIIDRRFSMPRGDGSGPTGMGPMSGRGAGFCAGFNTPGYMAQGCGRGFGMGLRRGFGGRFGFRGGMAGAQRAVGDFSQMSRDQEIEILKNQANSLKDALENVQKKLEEIESDKKD